MKRKESNGARILLAVLMLAVGLQGCGIFNPDKGKPKPDPLPPMPPLSPQDVIDNMEYAYNHFEYEQRYQPLIRSDFTFVFTQEDVDQSTGDIPKEGWWGQPEELESAKNMLDQNFVPDKPEHKIDSMRLVIQLSGDLRLSNLEGVPEGTLEAYVTFDLEVTAGGGTVTFQVHSRPLFYFAPDDPNAEQKIWGLWKIADATYENP